MLQGGWQNGGASWKRHPTRPSCGQNSRKPAALPSRPVHLENNANAGYLHVIKLKTINISRNSILIEKSEALLEYAPKTSHPDHRHFITVVLSVFTGRIWCLYSQKQNQIPPTHFNFSTSRGYWYMALVVSSLVPLS